MEYKRILIKTPNWLGDAVMSLPTLRAMRYLFPDSHISVLSRANLAELFMHEPSINDIIPYETAKGLKKLGAEIRLIKQLKLKRFDLVLILPRSFHSALVSFLTKIPERVGYASEGRSGLLTQSLTRTKELLTQHRVYYFLNLLSALTKDIKAVPFSAPRITLSAEEEKWAAAELASAIRNQQSAISNSLFIGLNPGATYGDAKCWLPDRFVELSKRLLNKGQDYHILLFGGPAEQKLSARISRAIGSNRVIDFTGKTSILQLAALLKRCKCLVTNDTGPMHVAAAVGTPVVAIFGPTDTTTTSPFGSRHTIIRKTVSCAPCLKRACPTDHRCMKLITVDEVFKECEKYL
jgi:heptosyltransferase-2